MVRGEIEILERTEAPLLVSSLPYEDYQVSYCNVLEIAGKFHLWYGAYDHTYKSDSDGFLCYAHSADGVSWKRPELDLFDYAGSKANNIVFGGSELGGAHGHAVFLDSAAPEGERFKIVFTKWVEGLWWVFGGVSPNGLDWTVFSDPIVKHNSDTQTVCFRDGDTYRMYVRMWRGGDFSGTRIVGYTESPSFEQFPNPEPILEPDDSDPSNMHFYTNGATKLREGLYVMFPAAFYTGEDVVFPHFAFSEDGKNFSRSGKLPVIDGGSEFDRMGVYVAPGAIRGLEPNTWWFYYTGTNVGHDATNPRSIRHRGGIGRFLARIDVDSDV